MSQTVTDKKLVTSDEEYRPLTRQDLMTWAPDGQRQAMAWNRLRRVCIELRLSVPSLTQVRETELDFSGDLYVSFKNRYSAHEELFPEEFQSVVICYDEDGKEQMFVQFDAGYRLE